MLVNLSRYPGVTILNKFTRITRTSVNRELHTVVRTALAAYLVKLGLIWIAQASGVRSRSSFAIAPVPNVLKNI